MQNIWSRCVGSRAVRSFEQMTDLVSLEMTQRFFDCAERGSGSVMAHLLAATDERLVSAAETSKQCAGMSRRLYITPVWLQGLTGVDCSTQASRRLEADRGQDFKGISNRKTRNIKEVRKYMWVGSRMVTRRNRIRSHNRKIWRVGEKLNVSTVDRARDRAREKEQESEIERHSVRERDRQTGDR